MTRGARSTALRVVGALVAIQAIAVAVYLLVERDRTPRARPSRREAIANVIAPPLQVERAGGASIALEGMRGRFVLVHFWATWCPPCRREMPALLETADELRRDGQVELLAVSVDDDWPKLRAYFDGAVPDPVVRMLTPDAQRMYGTSTLPDTYLVARDGRLVERFAGAQDWRDPALRAYLFEVTR